MSYLRMTLAVLLVMGLQALLPKPAQADMVWVQVSAYEAVVQPNGGWDWGPGRDWKVRFRVPSYVGPNIWNSWRPSFNTNRAAQTFDVSWNTGGYRRWSLGNGYDVMEFTAGLRARGTRYAWWASPWDWANEFRIVVPVWWGRV